jgi:DNA invertase Pin-like site-specific DNA recombinase
MTKHAPQFDGYVRVSRTAGRSGDSFISPQVQREQIAGWAKLRGVEIAAWHEDLDQSGGKLDRPGLEALLARIESGETDGVVVAKLDRLSRLGVGDALKLVERITDAGGEVAAIDVGIDPTTPVGKFAQTLMLALAQMERERIAESWTVAQEHAIERGVPASRAPYGFRKDASGRLEPDPVNGPHIIEAFKLAASRDIASATSAITTASGTHTWPHT